MRKDSLEEYSGHELLRIGKEKLMTSRAEDMTKDTKFLGEHIRSLLATHGSKADIEYAIAQYIIRWYDQGRRDVVSTW